MIAPFDLIGGNQMNDDKNNDGREKWLLAALAPVMVVCCLGPILVMTFSSTIVAWIGGISGLQLAIVAVLAFVVGRAFILVRSRQNSRNVEQEIRGSQNFPEQE